MSNYAISRCLAMAALFVKEQLKEPVALFWMLISPAAVYYLLAYSGGSFSPSGSHLESTSWFNAYIASNVAFFGFAFYIVGRRESGFVRSFVYAPDARLIFMLAQFLAYSFIACVYCAVFYVLTCFTFGAFDWVGLLLVLPRFYMCYILFCVPGVLLSLLPVNFQNANTLFSILSFVMLVLSILGGRHSHPALEFIHQLNPLFVANQIMIGGFERHYVLIFWIVVSFIAAFSVSLRFLRINPVWSRY